MRDQDKTKEQLIGELAELRQRITELRAAETERKHAEEALRKSEARFRNIYSQSPIAIELYDSEGLLIDANPACLDLFGVTDVEKVKGFKLFEDPNVPKNAIQRLLAGEAVKFESEFDFELVKDMDLYETTKSGRCYVDCLITPWIVEEDTPSGLLVHVQDITERKRAEEALRESEEKFRNLAEHSPNMIFINKEGRIVYANQRCEEMMGYTADEFYSADFDFLTLIAPEHRELVKTSFGKHTKDQDVEPYEYALVTKDGRRIEVILTAKLINYGGERAILGTVIDITEHKQVEQKLLKEKTLLKTIIDNIPVLLVHYDPDTNMLYLNREFEKTVGWKTEEIKDIDLMEKVYPDPDYRKKAVECIRKASTEWEEFRIQSRSGKTIDSEWSNVRLDDGTQIGIGIDITERKQAEKERERLLAQIQGQAQRMQQIIDTVPEGVLLLNADGQVLLANPVAERDLSVLANARVGDTITHLRNRPLAELLTSPPKGLWHEVKADALHGQKERVFEIIAQPMGNGSEPEDWVLVINDVTQQREIKQHIQQQERLAVVGQLAAGIAHDFNNIMATIVLYAQMTARIEELPSVVRERMRTINQQAGYATKLIQQILDFSRRAVLERQPLDLALLLKEHIRLLNRTLPESIDIKLTHGPGEYVIHADPTRMQQAMTNLAVNARDAMPGGGTLHIGLERIQVRPGKSPLVPEMDPGEWVQVTVSDTGAGIPPDVLPHIFNPFFTTKAPGEGSGLGLAQVHGIVGQHGGRIDVESHVGKGTTFTIYLPAFSTHPTKPSGDSELGESLTLPKGKGESILVVEDNAIVRKALVESLELLNYYTREATNGQEALAMLEQHGDDIDLLLSDVVMPGMGGIALLHALKERGLTVKVVMITGHLLEKELDELHVHGMIDWLPKPPELEELAEVVARVLGTD